MFDTSSIFLERISEGGNDHEIDLDGWMFPQLEKEINVSQTPYMSQRLLGFLFRVELPPVTTPHTTLIKCLEIEIWERYTNAQYAVKKYTTYYHKGVCHKSTDTQWFVDFDLMMSYVKQQEWKYK